MFGSPAQPKAFVRNACLIPACCSAYLSFWPDGPMNGRPSRSSCLPGLMPMAMTVGPCHSGSPHHSPPTLVWMTVPPSGQLRHSGSRIVPHFLAGSAHSPAVPSNNCVLHAVTPRAVRQSHGALTVHLVGNSFQMRRLDAHLVLAEMVDLSSLGKGAIPGQVHPAVCVVALTAQCD